MICRKVMRFISSSETIQKYFQVDLSVNFRRVGFLSFSPRLKDNLLTYFKLKKFFTCYLIYTKTL